MSEGKAKGYSSPPCNWILVYPIAIFLLYLPLADLNFNSSKGKYGFTRILRRGIADLP